MKNIFNILLIFMALISKALASGFATPRAPNSSSIITVSQRYNDDVNACFGNSDDACFQYDTAVTPDTLVLGVGADSKNFIICDKADINTDWNKALSSNPTMCIQSSTEASTTARICLADNATDGLITTDSGDINMVPNGGDVNVTGNVVVPNANAFKSVSFGNLSWIADGTIRFADAAGTVGSSFIYNTGSFLMRNFANSAYQNVVALDFNSTQGALTAGTMAYPNQNYMVKGLNKFTWTNAMVTALGASTTGDISVATLPAKTVVTNAYIVIGTAETALTSLTVAIGRTGATYLDYITASNAKAAANTVYGDASAERGTNLTGYDLPSYTGTTVVNAHFISGVENLSTAVACTGIVYLETMRMP